MVFTAADLAHVKVFRAKLPPTPSVSDTHLSNAPVPVALTHTHAVSTVQPLSDGRVLFTQSSFTSPNEAFVLSGLDTPSKPLSVEQITRFSEPELQGKVLDEGEQYWFDGAGGFTVHGWILKPKGFKRDDNGALKKKKWPVAFLVHGGPQGKWEPSQRGWARLTCDRTQEHGMIPGPLDGIRMVCLSPRIITVCIINYSLVFAQQGYFVVMVNPTGSTSFGQGMNIAPSMMIP